MAVIKKIIIKYVIPPIGMLIIYLLGLTYRKEVVGVESEQSLIRKDINPIYALWHGRLLYLPFLYRWQGRRLYSLVSPSTDGEIIARTLKMFGVRTIRGSSYKSGSKAFRELIRIVKDKGLVFITVDGSRGPVFKVQKGILHLAKISGKPILPVTYGAEKAFVLKSWDRFIIPHPFTRVVVIYGEPVYVHRNTSEEEIEEKRAELEKKLVEMTDKADQYYKQSH
ncbi:MAG: lysophospholipid acyltransferase family protein [Nitrospirae bacterium]|nr:lysophospholipid acyltransferase family protein [Nitrospirota bacterium]